MTELTQLLTSGADRSAGGSTHRDNTGSELSHPVVRTWLWTDSEHLVSVELSA